MGWFDAPDKTGWFDFEKCPACGIHWNLCDCGREKSGLEEKLEIGSQFDIITPISAMTGIPIGCFVIIGALSMALIVLYGEMK